MSTNNFIDQLEHELRMASRRRVRVQLARVPRPGSGVVAFTVALAVCAAVAVPLLATRSSTTPAPQPSMQPPAPRTVVVGCEQTVIGQLRPGWRGSRTGTVVAGPVAWVYLGGAANQAAINRSHFVQSMAVVNPGPDVTVSIPRSERREISLDYTSVQPRSRFYLSQGASSVTFKPCARLRNHPAGPGRQFLGGFIVSRAQCAEIDVHVAGSATTIQREVALGRPCQPNVRKVLSGEGIGRARFGESPSTVIRRIDALLRQEPSRPYLRTRLCRIDHSISWSNLLALFHGGRFVGYSYEGGQGSAPVLSTLKGLQVGDDLLAAKRLYGDAFHVSEAQGGSYSVKTPAGQIFGYFTNVAKLYWTIGSIDAGYVGCPAMTP